VISLGNNLQQKVSKVQLHYSLEEITRYVGTPIEYVQCVYGDYKDQISDQTSWVDIDLDNLARYIEQTQQAVQVHHSDNYQAELQRNLNHALGISLIALALDGKMPHIARPEVSAFGREYYVGPNLQIVPKRVRLAALGPCWEYDLNSSAVAWKLSVYRQICDLQNLKFEAFETLEYIDHKARIRQRVAQSVFDTDEEWAVKIVKQAITAIGFGATAHTAHYEHNGRWRVPALATVITAENRLHRFLQDPWVANFIQEQRLQNRTILDYYRQQGQDSQWRQIPELCNTAGRLMPNSVMAYLYQQAETELMNTVRQFIPMENILLTVHDCIYTRTAIPGPQLREIRAALRSQGQYISIGQEQHTACLPLKTEIELHRERIKQEEQLAAQRFARDPAQPQFAPTKSPAQTWVEQDYNKSASNCSRYDPEEELPEDRTQIPNNQDWLPDWVKQRLTA